MHRQISRQIEECLRRGAVNGARLPSSRMLARLLGVSRNTVLVAYDVLAAGGLIEGRRGAAMLVRAPRGSGVPDLYRLLRDAQYPTASLSIGDPDGNEICLSGLSELNPALSNLRADDDVIQLGWR
jgi:DNA-binding FadR family transcriptional regulator